MQQKTLLTLAALAVIGGSLLTASPAYAAENTSWQDHWNAMIEKMASKFNLKKDDVKTVFNEVRTERQKTRQAEMEKRLNDRLNQAVKDGQITEEQKKLILAKHEELQKQQGSKRQELQDWAEKNGIDLQFVMGLGGGMGRGRGRGMGQGF